MVAGSNVDTTDSLQLLGVTLDSTLSLDNHVNKMAKPCNIIITSRPFSILVSPSLAMLQTPCLTIVGARLDYCNAIFHGMSGKQKAKLSLG